MSMQVHAGADAAAVLDVAGRFLASEPAHHNLILSLLERCVATGDPGRFWIVEDGGGDDGSVVGVVLQSPLHYFATMTPMTRSAAVAVADAIVEHGVDLPGINGEAATAAWFAGRWTDLTRAGARPVEGSRLYEVDVVISPRAAPGTCRRAGVADRDLVVEWYRAFEAEAAVVPDGDVSPVVDRRIASGQIWLWDDTTTVSLAGMSAPVAGASRIGPVFTPSRARGCGYASALVAAMSDRIRTDGVRCLLFTELANPTSNGIYRALGYRPISELTRYDFLAPAVE